MKSLDRVLQRWRIARAGRHIPRGSRVLDVGCFDGVLFDQLDGRVTSGVGIDPLLPTSLDHGHVRLIAGMFPDDIPPLDAFDVITMLAVVEHIAPERITNIARACARLLKPGGLVVITVPSPRVDQILALLKFFRAIDGMSLEEHHGLEPSVIPSFFARAGFSLHTVEKFQLGLNNLFVFQRTELRDE